MVLYNNEIPLQNACGVEKKEIPEIDGQTIFSRPNYGYPHQY